MPEAGRWDDGVLRAGGSFLQSFAWGEFQASLGREVFRLGSPAFQALLIRHRLPLGLSYLYCPRGPVALGAGPDAALVAELLERGRSVARGDLFLRLEPEWPADGAGVRLLQAQGFRRSAAALQPARTSVIDLRRPEEEIFGAMRKGRRYDIRLAARKGVSARRLGPEHYSTFRRLLEETARRDRFRTHSWAYYQRMLEVLGERPGPGPSAELWGAEHEGELLAINLVLFWGERAVYLHAASSRRHAEVMAPAFLQWQQMREAKRRGCREYDLWGVSEAWPGVTRFKRAFGGPEVAYAGAFDLPLRPLPYAAYTLLRRLRRLRS